MMNRNHKPVYRFTEKALHFDLPLFGLLLLLISFGLLILLAPQMPTFIWL